MAFHFDDHLRKNSIKSTAQKYNFKRINYVEKFILDFEINYHISKQLESIVRGGMCVPFYTGLKIRRLSIDIDLMTHLQTDEISSIMESLTLPMSDMTIRKHIPKKPAPIPNLITYNVNYKSRLGPPEQIKVDFLCDVHMQLPTRLITKNEEVMGLYIDYPLKILTRGALIGDKMTTLALDKIGLQIAGRGLPENIPKQIYDIASLLKSSSVHDIAESFDVFTSLTAFKTEIYDEGRYDIKGTLDTIVTSIRGLLKFEYQVKTVSEYSGIFSSFTAAYLGSSIVYNKTMHTSDILLVWFYAEILQKFFDGIISADRAAERIYSSIASWSEISGFDAYKKTDFINSLFDSMPVLPFKQNILHQTPADQIFLIKEIFSD